MKIDRRSLIAIAVSSVLPPPSWAKLADRARLVKHRQATGKLSHFHDNGRPLEGQAYRSARGDDEDRILERYQADKRTRKTTKTTTPSPAAADSTTADVQMNGSPEDLERQLSSQLSGCCYNYQKYYASDLCYLYGNDCDNAEAGNSHDSGDGDCSQDGLSFIGISFSVNTANGNPYSYQLCDQFPMENIIDRDYEYVMSMDEDGWLIGGGYKQFDYSGKMPYVDVPYVCEELVCM